MSSGPKRGPQPCACGQPKLPGQGQRYCKDCRELADWRIERRRTVTRLTLMRSPCQRCGGVKEPGKGRHVCQRCLSAPKPRVCQRCPTLILEPFKRLCAPCRAAAAEKTRRQERLRHKRNRLLGRFRRKKAHRRPRELDRIDKRLKAEREGRVVTRNNVKVRADRERVDVPVDPLLPYLLPRLEETGVTAFGEVASVSPKVLTRIVEGRARTIRIFQADKLCVALGLNLSMVYSEVA